MNHIFHKIGEHKFIIPNILQCTYRERLFCIFEREKPWVLHIIYKKRQKNFFHHVLSDKGAIGFVICYQSEPYNMSIRLDHKNCIHHYDQIMKKIINFELDTQITHHNSLNESTSKTYFDVPSHRSK